jgi:hypothetical protein
MIEVRRLTAAEGRESLGALAEVLVDCVDGGASVSFMAPFSKAAAEKFFEKLLPEVESGSHILLAAYAGSNLVGTVQIVAATPPNAASRRYCQATCFAIRAWAGRGNSTHATRRRVRQRRQ